MHIRRRASRMASVRKQKGTPTINQFRVLQWIASHEHDGTMYAPVGTSYQRAMDLVNFGPSWAYARLSEFWLATLCGGQELRDCLILSPDLLTRREAQCVGWAGARASLLLPPIKRC